MSSFSTCGGGLHWVFGVHQKEFVKNSLKFYHFAADVIWGFFYSFIGFGNMNFCMDFLL